MNETLLVTGAAGGLATLLRPALREAGYAVRLTDRRPVSGLQPHETFIRARLQDARAVRRACRGAQAILHLGATSTDQGWTALIDSNVTGMAILLEAARAEGVAHLVFASSMHVLGMHPRDEPVTEQSPTAPDSRYAATKLFGEAACQMFAAKYGLSVTTLRIGHAVWSLEEASPGLGIAPDDLRRLVLLALRLRQPGYRLWHAVAPHCGPSLSDGRLETEHGFTFHEPGPETERLQAQVDAATHLNETGRAFRGGDFAQDLRPGFRWRAPLITRLLRRLRP